MSTDDQHAPAARQSDDLPLKGIVRNPYNPRKPVQPKDVADLKLSIETHEVVQHATVVTMAAFCAANPDAGLTAEDGDHVLVIGERRTVASRELGRETIPAVIRDDLAPARVSIPVMLAENGPGRADLTPMEEAQAYRVLYDDLGSERKVAKAVGVSPGQVHKRLSLCRLPGEMASAVESGTLTVAGALELLKLPDEQLADAWTEAVNGPSWQGVPEVVARRLDGIAGAAEEARIRAQLTELGIEVVDSTIRNVLGADHWRHRLDVKDPAEVANPSDTLATVQRSSMGKDVYLNFYSRTIPLPEDDTTEPGTEAGASDGSTSEEDRAARLAELRERIEAAGKARAEICALLVNAVPFPHELAAGTLADAVLSTEDWGYDAVRAAAGWLGHDVTDEGSLDQVETWTHDQAAAGGDTALRAAFAVALADLEDNLVGRRVSSYWMADRPWTAQEARHVRRLAEQAGHELSLYEEEQLADADAAAALDSDD